MTDKLTHDMDIIKETLIEMTGASSLNALSVSNLLDAAKMLPFDTTLTWDKINGRYCFSSESEDDWRSIEDQVGYRVFGANFSFVDTCREKALGRGIHYYYHKRIKE